MYFVQIVNDGTPGALYEAGDDMAQAQELLLKVVASGRGNVEGPVEIDDDVREFVEAEGYYGNVFIVSSESWSDVDPYEVEGEDYVGYTVEDDTLYHTMYPEDSLGEFQDGRFIPSRFLLELPPDCHRLADAWATNYIGEQQDATS